MVFANKVLNFIISVLVLSAKSMKTTLGGADRVFSEVSSTKDIWLMGQVRRLGYRVAGP